MWKLFNITLHKIKKMCGGSDAFSNVINFNHKNSVKFNKKTVSEFI